MIGTHKHTPLYLFRVKNELLYRVYPNKNFEEFKYDYRVNLRNSIATLNLIEAPAHIDIGVIIEFKSQLYDKNGVNPFEDTFFIEMSEKEFKPKVMKPPIKKRRKEDKGDDSDDMQKTTSSVQIPEFIPVRKKDWDKYENMDGEDALVVKRAGQDGIFD